MAAKIPPIPDLNDTQLTLDLYKDDTLRVGKADEMKGDYGNVARLELLGSKCFELAVVAQLLEEDDPRLTKDQIETKRANIKSEEQLKEWFKQYDLGDKIITTDPSKYDDPKEIERFFNRFIGALYFRMGHQVAVDWVATLINPSKPALNGSRRDSNNPLPPSSPTVAVAGAGRSNSPQAINGNVLAMLNQKAQQSAIPVNYKASRTGPDHQPVWTVDCLLSGIARGTGVAPSQKVAKEEAARQAWAAMGW